MGTPCHFFFICLLRSLILFAAAMFVAVQCPLLMRLWLPLFIHRLVCVFITPISSCACFFCPVGSQFAVRSHFFCASFSFLSLLSLLSSLFFPSSLSSLPLLFLSSLAFLFFFPFTSARHSASSLLLFLFLFTPSLPPQAPFTSFHRIIFSSHLLSSHLLLLPSSTCPYSLVPLLIPFSHLTIPLRLIIRSSSLHLTIQGNHPQPCHSPFLVHIHLSKLRPLVPYKSHTKTKSCVGYLCSPDGRTVCSRRWRLSCSCSQSNRSTPLDQVSNCILLPRSYILLSDFITAHLLQMLVRFICA